jgi:hypothetical protein
MDQNSSALLAPAACGSRDHGATSHRTGPGRGDKVLGQLGAPISDMHTLGPVSWARAEGV